VDMTHRISTGEPILQSRVASLETLLLSQLNSGNVTLAGIAAY